MDELSYRVKIDADDSELLESIKIIGGKLQKLEDNEVMVKLSYDGNYKGFTKELKEIYKKAPQLGIRFEYDLNKKALDVEKAKLDKMELFSDSGKLFSEFEAQWKNFKQLTEGKTDAEIINDKELKDSRDSLSAIIKTLEHLDSSSLDNIDKKILDLISSFSEFKNNKIEFFDSDSINKQKELIGEIEKNIKSLEDVMGKLIQDSNITVTLDTTQFDESIKHIKDELDSLDNEKIIKVKIDDSDIKNKSKLNIESTGQLALPIDGVKEVGSELFESDSGQLALMEDLASESNKVAQIQIEGQLELLDIINKTNEALSGQITLEEALSSKSEEQSTKINKSYKNQAYELASILKMISLLSGDTEIYADNLSKIIKNEASSYKNGSNLQVGLKKNGMSEDELKHIRGASFNSNHSMDYTETYGLDNLTITDMQSVIDYFREILKSKLEFNNTPLNMSDIEELLKALGLLSEKFDDGTKTGRNIFRLPGIDETVDKFNNLLDIFRYLEKYSFFDENTSTTNLTDEKTTSKLETENLNRQTEAQERLNQAKAEGNAISNEEVSQTGKEVDAIDEVTEAKKKQNEIIQATNPRDDDVNPVATWITSTDDIKTWKEAMDDPDYHGGDFAPDFTWEDALNVEKAGTVTVYSSKPIENGNFVTPSYMEAQSYSGNGKVYSKEMNVNDIAWIDIGQGQVAILDDYDSIMGNLVEHTNEEINAQAKLNENQVSIHEETEAQAELNQTIKEEPITTDSTPIIEAETEAINQQTEAQERLNQAKEESENYLTFDGDPNMSDIDFFDSLSDQKRDTISDDQAKTIAEKFADEAFIDKSNIKMDDVIAAIKEYVEQGTTDKLYELFKKDLITSGNNTGFGENDVNAIRKYIMNSKITYGEDIPAEFGDDWNTVRNAMGVGVMRKVKNSTSDHAGSSASSLAEEINGLYGQNIFDTDTDDAGVIQQFYDFLTNTKNYINKVLEQYIHQNIIGDATSSLDETIANVKLETEALNEEAEAQEKVNQAKKEESTTSNEVESEEKLAQARRQAIETPVVNSNDISDLNEETNAVVKANEALEQYYEDKEKIISQIGIVNEDGLIRNDDGTIAVDDEGNPLHDYSGWSYVKKTDENQLQRVRVVWVPQTTRDEEGNVVPDVDDNGQQIYRTKTIEGKLITDFEGLANRILKLDSEISNKEGKLESNKIKYDNYDDSEGLSDEIGYLQTERDLLLGVLKYYSDEEEYVYEISNFEKQRIANNDKLEASKKEQIKLAKQAADDKFTKNIESANRGLNKTQIAIDSIERTYSKAANEDLRLFVPEDSNDFKTLANKRTEITTLMSKLKDTPRTSANENDWLSLEKLVKEYKDLAKAKLKANNPVKGELSGQNLDNAIEVLIADYDSLIERTKKYGKATEDTTKRLKEMRDSLVDENGNPKKTLTAADYNDKRIDLSIERSNFSATEKVFKNQNVTNEINDYVKSLKSLSHLNLNKVASFDLGSYQTFLSSFSEDDEYLDDFNTKLKNISATINQNILTGLQSITNRLSKIDQSEYTDNVKNQINGFNEEINNIKTSINEGTFDISNPETISQLQTMISKYTEFQNLLSTNKAGKESTLQNVLSKAANAINNNSAMSKELHARYQALISDIQQMIASGKYSEEEVNQMTLAYDRLDSEMRVSGQTGKSFFQNVRDQAARSNAQFLGMYFSWQDWIRYAQEAFQVVEEFDTALTKMSYTMDVSNEQLSAMGDNIIDMATKLGTSISDVEEIYQIYANMNTTAEELQTVAEPTAILSNLAGIDAATAADDIQGVINQFDLAAEDASHIVDVFDYVSANISVDYSKGIESIASAVQNVGNVASMAGLSFEQLSSIIGKVVEQTRQEGSTVGNSLKTIMTRLSKASTMDDEVDNDTLSKASEALNSIGIKVYETSGEYREFDTIMTELSAKWDSLTEAQQSNISYQIAATRQTSIMKAILSNWTDSMDLATEATEANGNAMENQEKYTDSYAGKLQEIKNELQKFAIELMNSDVVDTVLDVALDGLTSLEDTIELLAPILQEALNILKPILETITTIVDKTGKFGTIATLTTTTILKNLGRLKLLNLLILPRITSFYNGNMNFDVILYEIHTVKHSIWSE